LINFKKVVSIIVLFSFVLTSCGKGNDVTRVPKTDDSHNHAPLTTEDIERLCSLTAEKKSACAKNSSLSYCPHVTLSTEEQKSVCADSCIKYPTRSYCLINSDIRNPDSSHNFESPKFSWTKIVVIGSLVFVVIGGAIVAWYVHKRAHASMYKKEKVGNLLIPAREVETFTSVPPVDRLKIQALDARIEQLSLDAEECVLPKKRDEEGMRIRPDKKAKHDAIRDEMAKLTLEKATLETPFLIKKKR
jgi:hypothetical protein